MHSEKKQTLVCVQHSYGSHDLQRFGVWERPAAAKIDPEAYWIIFLHGGAWRDPRNTFKDFVPCVEYMNSSTDTKLSSVRGYISIDHRLSPHPDFPQDPLTTEAHALRAAEHPDHIRDVHSALALAQDLYDIKQNYIFIGHSSGATIGYQLLMGSVVMHDIPPEREIYLPSAIIGIYGIYDLIGLNQRYKGEYSSFLEGAFGADPERWWLVSPSCFPGNPGAAHSRNGDCTGRRFNSILADSPDDKLLDSGEVAAMREKLVKDGVNVKVVDNLVGDHDFVWRDASQVAQLVSDCLTCLTSMG